MKILSIDTSSQACSAALIINNDLRLRYEIAPQQHSELILKQCDELLAEAELKPSQLDAIAFGQGPGSFTGLRIAAGVTQGIAFASNLPVVGISTLAAQAQKLCSQFPDYLCLSTIDARMSEIYWGAYYLTEHGLCELQGEEHVSNAAELNGKFGQRIIGVGSGWKEYKNELKNALNHCEISEIFPEILPSAEEIAILAVDRVQRGDVCSADQAIPVYLRNNVAKKAT